MKTIYKYTIQVKDYQELALPEGHRILSVGLDPQGVPSLWACVDTNNKPVKVPILLYGTGELCPASDNKHLGTFVHGSYVWHVFTD